MSATSLNALTLNCYGVRKDLPRFERIAKAITAKSPDVVFLQEVVHKSQAQVLQEVFETAGYHLYFKPAFGWRKTIGLVAGGLAIAVKKRFDFSSYEFVPFTRQAAWNHVFSWSDAFLRKGVLVVNIDVDKRDIRLISTHTLGAYNRRPHIEEEIIRSQRRDIKRLCNGKARVVIGADLNTTPDQVIFTSLTDVLQDQPEAVTVDNKRNRFRQTKLAKAAGRGDAQPNRRIDYILTRRCTVLSGEVTLDDLEDPLSDHWAIEAKLLF